MGDGTEILKEPENQDNFFHIVSSKNKQTNKQTKTKRRLPRLRWMWDKLGNGDGIKYEQDLLYKVRWKNDV